MKRMPLVRRMKEADLDRVLEIESHVFADPWSRRSYEYELTQNQFSVPIVMIHEGKIVGHAVAWSILEEFHIASIAIDTDYQGMGWGSHLLKTLLSMADLSRYAILEVRKSNEAAMRLYEKMGFEICGKRKRYYRNGEDAIVMKKPLGKVQTA